ncbi:MAG: 50S ribosomal protein L32 [Patescibacteria group bacterium]
MAEPKKQLTRTRSRKRKSSSLILGNVSQISNCSHCKSAKRPHTICNTCGYYRGIKVISKKLKTKASK